MTNGGWPEGLSADVHDLPDRFDEHSSLLTLAQAYAAIALAYGHEHPKIVQALEFLRNAGHDMAIQLGRLAADVKRLADSRTSSIPPMRDKLDSSPNRAEELARTVSADLVKADKTPGPALVTTPDQIEARIKSGIEGFIRDEKNAANQRVADEVETAKAEAKKKWDKLKMQIVSAVAIWVVLGILGIIAGVALLGARVVAARAAGHAEGVQEVRSLVAPPPPEAQGSSGKPIAPAQAPAMIAPAR